MPNFIDASFADQKMFDYFMVDNEQNINNNKHKNKTHIISRQSPQRRCKKQQTSTPSLQQQATVKVGIPTPSLEQINSCSSHDINVYAYPLLSRFATVLADYWEGNPSKELLFVELSWMMKSDDHVIHAKSNLGFLYW